MYDRNDRSPVRRVGGAGSRFGGATVAVVAVVALKAVGVDERGEGAIDLAGFLVAAERSRISVRLIPLARSLASAQMSLAVGSPRLSPNTQRVESCVAPDRERGIEVRAGDHRRAVEQA